jgi:cysteine desulfurase family protein (TIGR01976 family)
VAEATTTAPTAGSALADIETIRRHFPALERVHAGHPVAYFDGPGGTQVPRGVVDAMADYLYNHNANRKWAYPSSHETDGVVASARATMATFFGCGSEDVVFGPNMTTLTYHLSRTLATVLEEGDEIVLTRLDHMANVSPWKRLEAEVGCVIREVPFRQEDGTLDMDAYVAALGPRTKLAAIGWASNALGTVTDIVELVRLAKDAGAVTFVDGVHAIPHILPDVAALGCDFLACSPYKFYGPHAGVLYAPAERLDALDIPRLPCAPQQAPERFESGTASFEDMAGSAAAVDFLASLGDGATKRDCLGATFSGLHARGEALVHRLWSGLSDLPGVRLYGPPPGSPRTSTVAFTLAGRVPYDVAAHLAESQGVFVSSGNFYATSVMEDLGLPDGVVRAGCACYTTSGEVDRLIAGVAEIA